MSQLVLYSNSGKNDHLICIYCVVVSVWVVCLFCFYRKNVVPRCPSLDVSSLNAFVGSEINGSGAFPLWEPSQHSDSFSLLVLTFNLQSLFSPLWLHLANPDPWFYLVLSLADLTFWSHGPKSSTGTWAEWLMGCAKQFIPFEDGAVGMWRRHAVLSSGRESELA